MNLPQWTECRLRRPAFGDPELDQRAKVLDIIVLVILAGMATFMINRLVAGTRGWVFPLLAFSVLLLIPPALVRQKRLETASAVLLWTTLGLFGHLAYTTSGLQGTVLFVVPSVLVVAGLVLKKRHFIAFSVASLLMIWAIALAEMSGTIPPEVDPRTRPIDVINISVVLVITAVTIGLLANNLRRSLERTRRSEQELRQSQETYRAIARNFPGGAVILFDTDLNYRVAEGKLLATLGMASGELEGKPCWQSFPPEMRERAREQYLGTLAGKESRVETQFGDFKLEVYYAPVRNAEGEIFAGLAIVLDITERKRAEEERQKLEAQLFQAQKLESIGTLAAGIAHDFNNLLNIIMGNSSILAEGADDRQSAARRLKSIIDSTERGAQLVRQLLTFARQTAVRKQSVRIDQLVEEVAQLMAATFPKTIEIVCRLQAGTSSVTGDPTQLHQVLMNLCVNARDAMPGGGRITLATETVEGASFQDEFPGAGAGKHLRLTVSDTGVGFDAETQARIFDPFFTTKEPGKGTGLGLAVALGIIRNHDGWILAHSQPGRGSDFVIYLPLEAQFTKPAMSDARASDSDARGTETVLFVDDEPLVRSMTGDFLKQKGYSVLYAEDGKEAIRVFREHASRIALVLSDLGLPRCDGEEVCRQVRALRPDVPFIITSGYVDPEKQRSLTAAGVNAILMKPYHLTDVLGKARELLDRGGRLPVS